jgi:hypothetical protein
MSNDRKDPEDIVRDGVEDGSRPGAAPVAREEGQSVRPAGSGSTEAQAEAGARDGNRATGPAEEQDEQSADDRGLTTDSSPD